MSPEVILPRWGLEVTHDIVDKHIPLRQLADSLDQMQEAFAKDEVPTDPHLGISVQMAQEASSAFPPSTSLHCRF